MINKEKINLKEIFDFCMSHEWDDLKLRELGKKLKIEGTTINELAKSYIDELAIEENLSPLAKQKLIETIEEQEKISQEKYNLVYKTNPILYQYNIITYQNWRNKEEKELFLRTIYSYAIKVKFNSKELTELAYQIGISYNTINKYINTYSQTYLFLTKEELKNIKIRLNKKETKPTVKRKINPKDKKVLKKIYDYCTEINYSPKGIKVLADRFDLNPDTIVSYAKKYYIEELGFSEEEWHNERKKAKDTRVLKRQEEKQNEKTLLRKIWENEETRKEYLKYIHDYCEKVKYKRLKLKSIAKKLDVTPETIINHSKRYELEYLGTTNEQWIQKRKEFRTERKKINQKKCPEKYVKRIGNTEKERLETYKYIYETCETSKYSQETLTHLAIKYNVKEETIRNIARKYAIEVEKRDPDEYKVTKYIYLKEKQREINKANPSRRAKIYYALRDTTDPEEIKNIIENSGYNKVYLENEITEHSTIYQDINEEEIKEKFNIYKKYINSQYEEKETKQKQERYDNLTIYIKKYIDSPCITINNFCKEEQIERIKFRQAAKKVKEHDQELYNEYLNKLNSDNQIIKEQAKMICYYIENGIQDNQVTRKFDLIDYYMLTDVPLNEMRNNIRDDKDNPQRSKFTRVINTFATKYRDSEMNIEDENHIEKLKEERIITNFEKDELGNPIPRTGKELDSETKTKLIDYLKDNHIPVNRTTYNLMIYRYNHGFISFENSKKLAKKI